MPDPFKNYFNDNFNFNNKINSQKQDKRDLVYKLQNFQCDGDIMLEPRLQEYLNRKKFYNENNIKSDISLETEFQITNDDIKLIRSYMKGNTDIYNKNNNPLNKKTSKKIKIKPPKPDERVLKTKKIDDKTPKNMGMFSTENDDSYFYEVMSRSPQGPLDTRDMLEKTKNFGELLINKDGIDDESLNTYHNKRKSYVDKRNKHILSKLGPVQHANMYPDSQALKYYDNREYTKYSLGLRDDEVPNSKPLFEGDEWKLPFHNKKPTKKEWNPYVEYNHYPSELTAQLYKKKHGSMPEYDLDETAELDFNNRMIIPHNRLNSKKSNLEEHGSYQSMPYMDYGDAELETEIMRGMPSRTSKTFGYRNPEEHYFRYVDDDITDPNNNVLPFPRGGEGTRVFNKMNLKKY
jgi:hypothetical protein